MLTASTANGDGGLSVAVFLISVAAYFIPTAIAWIRRVPNAGSVTVVNVFLGWTVIGWIVALAMACRSKTLPVAMTQQVNISNRNDG